MRKDLNKETIENQPEGEAEPKEDLGDWSWMDSSKKAQLANMESQMLDEYTQSIIKNGLRPMFEFNFFQEDIKQAAAELQKINERNTESPLEVEIEETTTISNDESLLTTLNDFETDEQDVTTEHDHEHELHEHDNLAEHDHNHVQEHGEHDMTEHDHNHDHEHDMSEHDHGHEHAEHSGSNDHDHNHLHEHSDHDDMTEHAHHHDHEHHHDHHDSNHQNHFPTLDEDHTGLESTRIDLTDDEKSFIDLNNDLGFEIFKKLIKNSAWSSSNFVFSPFSAATSLAMLFLGARGDTSWEINEILKLDDIVSFNPHMLLKNVSDSLVQEPETTATCIKQIFIHQVKAGSVC